MLSRHNVGTYQGDELASNLSENAQPQPSQFTEPLWADSCLKSGISVQELIPLYKKKSAGSDCFNEPSHKILVREEKATTTTTA